jgi:3-deoxy-D-manno-octulosonic-acid transferase
VTENINDSLLRRLGLGLYTLSGLVAALALVPRLVLRHRPLARAFENMGERWGRLPADLPAGGFWVHAASAGEARAALALAKALERVFPGQPMVLSCQTPEGRRVVEAAGLPAFFFPFDLPGPTRRALEQIRPRAVLLVETELWPRFLHTCGQRGIDVAVVSGRLSPRRLNTYRRLAPLVRSSLEALRLCCAQSREDAARFEQVGVPPSRIRVTGNLKFDVEPPPADPAIIAPYRAQEADLVLVAGSTRPGEEAAVCEAFHALLRDRPRSLLILVPRHPQRAAEALAVAMRRLGPDAARLRSDLPPGGRPAACRCVVVDRLGELATLYALASIAYVGGSLVKAGGHSPIEPAACGVPTLFGTHMDHVREVARALLEAQAAVEVTSAADLRRTVLALSGDPARRARLGRNARSLVEAHRGAARRTAEALTELWASRTRAAAAVP